jgi:hypothetical protein
MKKLIITTLLISMLITPLGVFAQEEESKGITITPAFSEIAPGESYEIEIVNNDSQKTSAEIIPMLFSVDKGERKLVPDESKTSEAKEAVKIDKDKIEIAAKSSVKVNVKYEKEIKGFYTGVLILETSSQSGQVSLSGRLASVIVKTKLSDDDLKNIEDGLDIKTDVNIDYIGSLMNLGTQYIVVTTLENKTDKILKPSGDITYYLNDKRIDNQQLTTALKSGIFPSEKLEIEKTFTDERNFWDRIGQAQFKQEIKLADKSLTSEKSILAVPMEALIIGLGIVITLTVVGFSIYRKYLK